jgi:hypothetical protein
MSIRCLKFLVIEKGALRGFCDLALDSGIILHDCQLLESNGKRWIGLPGKAQLDTDKNVKKDATTGKVAYTPTVSIPDRPRRDLFNESALVAIDAFRSSQSA